MKSVFLSLLAYFVVVLPSFAVLEWEGDEFGFVPTTQTPIPVNAFDVSVNVEDDANPWRIHVYYSTTNGSQHYMVILEDEEDARMVRTLIRGESRYPVTYNYGDHDPFEHADTAVNKQELLIQCAIYFLCGCVLSLHYWRTGV